MLKKMSTLFNANVRSRTARSFLPSVAAVAVGAAIVAILVACSSDPPATPPGPMATLSAAETAGASGSIVNLTFTGLDKQIAKYWWVIVPDGDDPTEAQVRAGQDAAGAAAANTGNGQSSFSLAINAPTPVEPNPTLLLQVGPPRLSGNQEIFIVVEDADENATLLTASFTADNPGPDAILSVTETGTTQSDITLTFTGLDEAVAAYWWVVVPDGDTPDEDQIKAGTDSTDATAIAAGTSAAAGAPTIAAPTPVEPNPTLLLQVGPPRLGHGSYEVFIVLADAVGDSTFRTASFGVDREAPTVSGLTFAEGTNDGGLTSAITLTFAGLNEQVVQYWWVVAPVISMPTVAQVQAGTGGADALAGAIAAGTSAAGAPTIAAPTTDAPDPTLVLDGVTMSGGGRINGDAQVAVVVEDALGNSAALTPSNMLSIDGVRPTLEGSQITFSVSSGMPCLYGFYQFKFRYTRTVEFRSFRYILQRPANHGAKFCSELH